jgi:hypothetical protein
LRRLDFTCCDIDPAILGSSALLDGCAEELIPVLARNILLYTLLADLPSERIDEYLQRIWNFYYHFFVDQGTLDMLLKQCRILVDLSPDIVTWNNSKYGIFLRFSSQHSLSTIRKQWVLYLGTKDFSKDEMDSLRAEFRKCSRVKDSSGADVEVDLVSLRSAGPLWNDMTDVGPKQFRRYWETGVTFDEQDKVAKAKEINPTFAYSVMGKGFALHYGSDPILSFHLAETLARSNKTVTTSGLVKGAVEEFKSWCIAFNKRLGERCSLMIRFLVGDVIACCRALHYCATNSSAYPGLYAGPWSSALMKLDGGDYVESTSSRGPLQFDVIDTSNLTDHMGLLNILIPCRPLMQTKPSSIIFTNTLHPSYNDDMTRDNFLALLCGDISVLSMILDLVPVPYLSNFTSRSNVHEIISSWQQFHEHMSWRIGSLSDSMAVREKAQSYRRLKFDERQLAVFFHGVYLKMFSDENAGALFPFSLQSTEKFTLLHYSRFTFAYVLRLVKDRVAVNWEDFMHYLHDLIFHDRKLLLGSNNLQDLFCNLHLLDVLSFHPFTPEIYADVKDGPLKRWENVPPVVCITLQVPRRSFDILEKYRANEIGTPILYCSLMGPAHNYFQHYQSFWGKIKAEYSKDSQEPKVTFKEDPEGFRGSSPAIFTFYAPSWILGIEESHWKATVAIRCDPLLALQLAVDLGPYLNLFSADITDRRYVHITSERPGNPGELQKLRNISFSRPMAQEVQPLCDPVKITLDSRVTCLTGRANIQDMKVKASLANGATVSVSQISPRVVQVSIGSHSQNIVYPFSIDSTGSKTRIARKSSYVEVSARVHPVRRNLILL